MSLPFWMHTWRHAHVNPICCHNNCNPSATIVPCVTADTIRREFDFRVRQYYFRLFHLAAPISTASHTSLAPNTIISNLKHCAPRLRPHSLRPRVLLLSSTIYMTLYTVRRWVHFSQHLYFEVYLYLPQHRQIAHLVLSDELDRESKVRELARWRWHHWIAWALLPHAWPHGP